MAAGAGGKRPVSWVLVTSEEKQLRGQSVRPSLDVDVLQVGGMSFKGTDVFVEAKWFEIGKLRTKNVD